MLADIDKLMEIQKQGLPIPKVEKLIAIRDAVKLVGKTKAGILLIRAKNPAEVEKQRVTWFVVGRWAMLDKSSLIKEALRRGWIEEV